MIRVIVESPYASDTAGGLDRNVRYLRAALADCLQRGEAPFASHALYTQPGVLRDTVPEERQLGIEAGFSWHAGAHRTVVYTDLGISPGMRRGIERAESTGQTIEYRTLPGWATDQELEHERDFWQAKVGALVSLIEQSGNDRACGGPLLAKAHAIVNTNRSDRLSAQDAVAHMRRVADVGTAANPIDEFLGHRLQALVDAGRISDARRFLQLVEDGDGSPLPAVEQWRVVLERPVARVGDSATGGDSEPGPQ